MVLQPALCWRLMGSPLVTIYLSIHLIQMELVFPYFYLLFDVFLGILVLGDIVLMICALMYIKRFKRKNFPTPSFSNSLRRSVFAVELVMKAREMMKNQLAREMMKNQLARKIMRNENVRGKMGGVIGCGSLVAVNAWCCYLEWFSSLFSWSWVASMHCTCCLEQ